MASNEKRLARAVQKRFGVRYTTALSWVRRLHDEVHITPAMVRAAGSRTEAVIVAIAARYSEEA